jgi:hypothetical protein
VSANALNLWLVASMPSRPVVEQTPPVSERTGDVCPPEDHAPTPKTRAQRFADAHAWVLDHHAGTFHKLAK